MGGQVDEDFRPFMQPSKMAEIWPGVPTGSQKTEEHEDDPPDPALDADLVLDQAAECDWGFADELDFFGPL